MIVSRPIIEAHFDACEKHLMSASAKAANAGHPNTKGEPREEFVSGFLTEHLAKTVAVGRGEIIDAHSTVGERRHQHDIIIYRSNFPKISLSEGVEMYFAESVVATIEVKSVLTKVELETGISAAHDTKRLKRNTFKSFESGYVPPGILSFLVAYDGPANIGTVSGWLTEIEQRKGLNRKTLPPSHEERAKIVSDGLEAIFLLQRGMLVFDNGPISLMPDETRRTSPSAHWTMVEQVNNNLMWLFVMLTSAVEGINAEWTNWDAYLDAYRPVCELVLP
jgi:hypothetical protein